MRDAHEPRIETAVRPLRRRVERETPALDAVRRRQLVQVALDLVDDQRQLRRRQRAARRAQPHVLDAQRQAQAQLCVRHHNHCSFV